MMLIKALAGTGKSTIATIIAEVCYETDAARDENEAVVILGPSRQLRGEHALDAHFTSQAGSSTGSPIEDSSPRGISRCGRRSTRFSPIRSKRVKDRGRKAGTPPPRT